MAAHTAADFRGSAKNPAGAPRLGPAAMGSCRRGRVDDSGDAAGLHTDPHRDRRLGEPPHQSAAHDDAADTVTAPIRDARIEPRPWHPDYAGGCSEGRPLAG